MRSAVVESSSDVVCQGYLARIGQKPRKQFSHMRFFVLKPNSLAYYRKKPRDNQNPVRELAVDGGCIVKVRAPKFYHGHRVYALSVYGSVFGEDNKFDRITMAAFDRNEAEMWKNKIKEVNDQAEAKRALSREEQSAFRQDQSNAGRGSGGDGNQNNFKTYVRKRFRNVVN